MSESITRLLSFLKRNLRIPTVFWTVLTVVCVIVSLFLDLPVRNMAGHISIDGWRGDATRTLESFKEFGQLLAVVVACLLIFLLDKPRRPMIPRLILCIVLPLAVLVWPGKLMVHRLRPSAAISYDTRFGLGFFWGPDPKPLQMDLDLPNQERIALDRKPSDSQKQSFPSAHTATAFALAAGLSLLYPAASPLFYVLAAGCGLHRIVFGAHWLSDVVASVFIGIFAAKAAWHWSGVLLTWIGGLFRRRGTSTDTTT